mmetsp:Transcript_183099/g.580466  ORF Transcript_183099/g.580466 Transcript_183099/m.580466 type:complete len:369 (+) Transcript_183099:206-1312(+)
MWEVLTRGLRVAEGREMRGVEGQAGAVLALLLHTTGRTVWVKRTDARSRCGKFDSPAIHGMEESVAVPWARAHSHLHRLGPSDGTQTAGRVHHHSAKLVRQKLTCRGALLRGASNATSDELAAAAGHAVRDRGQLVRSSDVIQGEHHVVECTIAPRLLSGRHLNDCASEAPDVRFATVAFQLRDDLWRHPRHGAQGGKRLRAVRAALRAAEVRELNAEVQVDQKIGPLDVAMHHRRRACMQIVQALQYSHGRLLQRHPLEGPKLAQDRGHGAAGDVLEVYVQALVAIVVAEVADDVRVPQRPADVELRLQPLPMPAVEVGARLQHRLLHSKNLQGRRVEGLVHGAEGARADDPAARPAELLAAKAGIL